MQHKLTQTAQKYTVNIKTGIPRKWPTLASLSKNNIKQKVLDVIMKNQSKISSYDKIFGGIAENI